MLSILSDEEPDFIPAEGTRFGDSTSESDVEHTDEEETQGDNPPRSLKDKSWPKSQTCTVEKTTTKSTKVKQVKNAKEALPELEDGGQATVDELLKIDLGEKGNPRPTYVSALL